MSDIEGEVVSIGKISVDDLNNNPDLIREKVELKIYEILDKYGFRLGITHFSWGDGQIAANITVVKKEE